MKTKTNHLALNSESKQMAVDEVESRNQILSDSLDKVKIELYGLKKTMSQMENEKMHLESECQKMKKEIKSEKEISLALLEEKEHLL